MSFHGLQDRIDDLDRRFWAWRATQAPRSRDDLPRLDRPAGWSPAWRAVDVAEYRERLGAFEVEQAALLAAGARDRTTVAAATGARDRTTVAAATGARDRTTVAAATGGTPAGDRDRTTVAAATGGTPAGERGAEVDLRLIGSAIARARYELDVLRPWQRDPWFYLDQTVGTVYDLLLPPPPIGDQRCAELILRLQSFATTLEAGRHNGTGELALELATLAQEMAPRAGTDLMEALAELTPFVSSQWPAQLDRAGRVAAAALDEYARWLAGALTGADALEGAGEPLFARYVYEVALLPYTPAELLAAGRQEWDRAVAFELFERHRVPDAPWPPLPTSAEEQSQAEALLEGEVRRYYEGHDLLSQPATLRHYLNAPRPPYLEPLRWLGVSDDLTGPERLDDDGISYVPVPSADLPYFYRANAADPRAGVVHEGAHYQQLALSWRHPRPARRHFYDSCPNEGLAFYNEEMLTQAGLFDDAPVTRRIVYNFMRLRALRVEVDVRLALGEISIDEAGALLAAQGPDGPRDGDGRGGVLRRHSCPGAFVHGGQAPAHATSGRRTHRRGGVFFAPRVPRLAVAQRQRPFRPASFRAARGPVRTGPGRRTAGALPGLAGST